MGFLSDLEDEIAVMRDEKEHLFDKIFQPTSLLADCSRPLLDHNSSDEIDDNSTLDAPALWLAFVDK
jgi:hypothetical protein